MDEAVVAKIDSDMRERKRPRIEEHQIAGLQVVCARALADAAQFARVRGQHDAGGFLEHVVDQAAAVESALGRGAAVPIVDADERQREQRDVARAFDHARRCGEQRHARRLGQRAIGGALSGDRRRSKHRRHGEDQCGEPGRRTRSVAGGRSARRDFPGICRAVKTPPGALCVAAAGPARALRAARLRGGALRAERARGRIATDASPRCGRRRRAAYPA